MQGLTAECAAGACGQEVTFKVHDDEPVGLDGLRVEFDDERAVSDAGVMLVATLANAWGSKRWRGGWSGCDASGRAPRTPGAR